MPRGAFYGEHKEMYTLINENAERLAQSFKKEHPNSVGNYQRLQNHTGNIDERLYRKFYGMNGKGLTTAFFDAYFAIITTHSIGSEPLTLTSESMESDFRRIVTYLASIESDGAHHHKVHFSFSTKLLHTLNKDAPIYDSNISAFYFLPQTSGGTADQRIEKCVSQYAFLIREYERIKSESLLAAAIEAFSRQHEDFSTISFTKQVDFILWHFTKTLQNTEIAQREILYR